VRVDQLLQRLSDAFIPGEQSAIQKLADRRQLRLGRLNKLTDYDSLENRTFIGFFGRSMCQMWPKLRTFGRTPKKQCRELCLAPGAIATA
jgi:hypothetical protein